MLSYYTAEAGVPRGEMALPEFHRKQGAEGGLRCLGLALLRPHDPLLRPGVLGRCGAGAGAPPGRALGAPRAARCAAPPSEGKGQTAAFSLQPSPLSGPTGQSHGHESRWERSELVGP